MKAALTWALAGFAIVAASLAVFVFAAFLFPGNPVRFYQLAGTVLAATALVSRLASGPMR